MASGERPPLARLLAEMNIDPASAVAATEALAALTEAGLRWRDAGLAEAFGSAATNGNGYRVPSKAMVTTAEAALLLDRSQRRVRQLAAAGDRNAVRIPRGWRFSRDEVVGYRNRNGS